MFTWWILGVGNEPLPASIEEFMVWQATQPDDWWVVKQYELVSPEGEVRVSTVFLHGLNSSFTKDGPPILWETMVFGGDMDGYQERYTSHEDAVAGHDETVKLVLEARDKTTEHPHNHRG